MTIDETEFSEFMAAMGMSEEKFASLHPAVQRAWRWNYDTMVKMTMFDLSRILKTVKGENK